MHQKPNSSPTASFDPSPLLERKSSDLRQSFIPFDVEGRGEYAFNLIRLNNGITVTNYVCSQLYYIAIMFSFAMTDALQPLILLSHKYYNIDEETAGTTLSSIIVLQLIVKLLVAVLYGHLNDKFGRRKMIIFGAINFAIGCFLAPIQRRIFPGFIFAKVLLSNGASALGIVPLNADYVHDESKGKAAGITVTLVATGAFLSNIFLKGLFHLKVSLGECYFITGFLVIVMFGLICLGLKGGNYYMFEKEKKRDQQQLTVTVGDQSLIQNIKEVIQIFRASPWLSIAVVLQTLGNSDFFVASVLLTLYIKSLFPEGTKEMISNMAVNNVQTMIFLPALLSNIAYGVYIDKTNKVIGGTLLALAGGAIAFFLTSFVHTPYDWQLYLAAILMGLTVPGIYVTGNYLGIKHFPKEKRGIMYGMMALIGYFGYVIVAFGGGYLFDHWRKNGPFIIYTGLLILALVLVERIYRKRIKGAQPVKIELMTQ